MPFVPVTGLEDKRGNRLRAFELNGFLNHRQRRFRRLPSALDAVIRIEHAHHARNSRLSGPSAGIAGQRDRARSRAMIRAIARDDFVSSSKKARQLDSVLGGFGAAIGKEKRVDVAGRNFGQLLPKPRAHLSRHERIRITERRGLLGNRLNHALIAVSDVDRHELAVEVDESLPFRRPEINAFGPRHRNRIDLRLRRPLVQSVLLGQVNNFLAGHRGRRGRGRHSILAFQNL